jgi:hypothetical protein
MRRNYLIAAMILMAAALTSSALMAAPIPVSTIVFLQYDHAQGPALGINVNGTNENAATGEYVFKMYSANQSGGTLAQGTYLGTLAVWCLTPFATIGSNAVAFALGNGTNIGQLHDVSSISDPEADSFYRDTTAMYQLYYSLGSLILHDDLQAAIWERRDMIEGPALTKSTNVFDINNDANKGQFWVSNQTNIPSVSQFANLIPASGAIWDLYTPIGSRAVGISDGDVQLGNYYYSYDHSKQEFGYVTNAPEPSSLLLMGGGLLVAAGLLRRKK